MTDWFDQLYEDRSSWIAATRKNNFEHGIHQSTVDKYADPVHFVYELLQNAEDQGATEALFALEPDRLIFEHNGIPFTRQDVENITGLGNSDKPKQANRIGRFGIGFKSVFVITASPRIYTSLDGESFAFAIRDLVVPARITFPDHYIGPGKTRFVLDFLQDKATSIYEQIQTKLASLGADTMLFLRNLTAIHWRTSTSEAVYYCDRSDSSRVCRLIGESGVKGKTKKTEDVEYRVFSKSVTADGADRPLDVKVAFRLHAGEVVPEPGQPVVNVYFPTEEKFGLKFRLHAPFLLTDNRANIKRGDSTNEMLMSACGELLADSLTTLRHEGLLTVKLLSSLPIQFERNQQWYRSPSNSPEYVSSGEPWVSPLFDSVRKMLLTEPLLPSADGGYVVASGARMARSAALRDLLADDVLSDLSEPGSRIRWISSEVSEDNTPELRLYLRDVIGVEEIDPAAFAVKITREFLERRSDEWMIWFYVFLLDQRALWDATGRQRAVLRHNPDKPIIRLEQLEHVAPYKTDRITPNAFLSPTGDTNFPVVRKCIAQDEKAHAFLVHLGLKEPNIVDNAVEFILPKYAPDCPCIPEHDYKSDLEQIALAVQMCPPERQSTLHDLMAETSFVRAHNACDHVVSRLVKPGEAYIPTDHVYTWFEGDEKTWVVCPVVNEMGAWSTIVKFLNEKDKVVRNSISIGALTPSRQDGNCYITAEHSNHVRGLDGFDPRAMIDGLEHVLDHISAKKALILWDILILRSYLIKGAVEYSSRQNFDRVHRKETQYSSVGELCCSRKWLPDKTGVFYNPSDISLGELGEQFDINSHEAKILATQLGMRQDETQDYAEKLGIPGQVLDDLINLYRENPLWVQQMIVNRPKPAFPVRVSEDPVRRADKIAETADLAPYKTYELRSRSVRAPDTGVGVDKKSYLRDLYTNDDGELICQVCHEAMPFKLIDGQYYFEAVALIRDAEREIHENHLALCPTCSAKFHHANLMTDSELRTTVMSIYGLEIPAVLAQANCSIRFVQLHIDDLRVMLQSTAGTEEPNDT